MNVETPPVTGSPDQVDINVSVKERLVNNFMFGIGYSDADGALINASMNFKNFLGTGKEVALAGDNSKVNRHINLSYIDPYYSEDGISRSLNLYSTRTDAAAAARRLRVNAGELGRDFRAQLGGLLREAASGGTRVAVAPFSTHLRPGQTPEQQKRAAVSALVYMPFMTTAQ